MGITIRILQLILSLSVLVVVHEFGHYMFARIFGVRVPRFYMFFNPKFSILRAKRFNGKWHFALFAKNLPDLAATDDITALDDSDWRKYPESTEWGIGWVPFGGYCAIAGMVDETQGQEQLALEPEPWEFRTQKAWKRMLIISGGVLMNFVAAIVIYVSLLFFNGEEILPMRNAGYGYDYCQTARDYGFQNGDIILSVNGEDVPDSRSATEKIIIEGKCNVSVLRGNDTARIILPTEFGEYFISNNESALMQPRFTFLVGEIVKGSPAESAGLVQGDRIISLDGAPVLIASDFVDSLSKRAGSEVSLGIIRQNDSLMLAVTPDTAGKIGFGIDPQMDNIIYEHVDYGFLRAIPVGIAKGWETLVNYIKQFRLVFTRAGAKSVGGFIAIGKIFPDIWDWAYFWSITAFISVILAFMNILPIPVLDGGYLLMILIEMITGRTPSEKVLNIATNIGFWLLIALLIYANGNDILKLIFHY